MREVFAHDAVIVMDGSGEVRAPGAAITAALCGHWEHDPPCPLAPHHTAADRDGDVVRLRVLFATETENEPEVRRRIGDALAAEKLTTPDGAVTRWTLLAAEPGPVRPHESEHTRRLAGD